MDKLEYHIPVNPDGVNFPERMAGEIVEHFAGRKVCITVEDDSEIGTPDQRKYYFAVVVKYILKGFVDVGYCDLDKDEVHGHLKWLYLPKIIADKETAEEKYRFPRSTKRLKKWQWCLYIDDCIRFAAQELHVSVPPPNSLKSEYLFPQFQAPTQTREEFIAQTIGYCEQITDLQQLRQYYNQNADWKTDEEIKNIFVIRANYLKGDRKSVV